MIHADLHLYIAIGAGVAVAVALYSVIFNGSDDFLECLRYIFQPGWLSMLRGEWLDDFWGSLKIWAWLGISGLAGWSTYTFIATWFPAWFS